MSRRALGIAALAACLMATPLGAQSSGMRYLHLDSWIVPYVEHLIRSGVLQGLDPLSRPLRRADVARALDDVDVSSLAWGVQSTVEMLRDELDEPTGEARFAVEPEIAVTAGSDASRWERRPAGAAAGVWPRVQLGMALELPWIALVTAPTLDNRLKDDSLFNGKKSRVIAGRNAQAYGVVSLRYVEIAFGNVDRNWGPTEVEGLLVSPAPYNREQFMLRLGPRQIRLELLVQGLNPLVPWDSVSEVPRWLIAHRVVVRPSERLSFSIDESAIYAGPDIPWRFLNPLTPGLLTQYDGAREANSFLAASFDWRARGATRLFGQLMLDDIQVDNASQGDQEPPGYGFTIGASGAAARGGISWAGFYTRVTNLAYRTPNRQEEYTSDSIGMGRAHSDYDEALLRLALTPAARLLVGAEISLLRQGEGDIRERYPPISAFADSLDFLTGIVERSATIAGRAHWSPHRSVSLSAYAGYRSTTNAAHVAGASRNRWIWRLQLASRLRLSGALPGT